MSFQDVTWSRKLIHIWNLKLYATQRELLFSFFLPGCKTVFSRTDFLNTLQDTLGFTPKVGNLEQYGHLTTPCYWACLFCFSLCRLISTREWLRPGKRRLRARLPATIPISSLETRSWPTRVKFICQSTTHCHPLGKNVGALPWFCEVKLKTLHSSFPQI